MDVADQEAEVYDRQIRLWGVEAQRRIQQSNVLLYGLGGLHAEVAKNLVLAGINVTVQDPAVASEHDLSSQFMLDESSIGKHRAVAAHPKLSELNALASVACDTASLGALGEDYLSKFDAVLLSECTYDELVRCNAITRSNGKACFYSRACGLEGLFISDFGESYTYATDTQRPVERAVDFPPLSSVVEADPAKLGGRFGPPPSLFATVMQQLKQPSDDGPDAQLSPVCAILGGFLAQEVIKFVSKQGEPMRNVFVFSALSGEGKAFLAGSNS